MEIIIDLFISFQMLQCYVIIRSSEVVHLHKFVISFHCLCFIPLLGSVISFHSIVFVSFHYRFIKNL